MFSFFCCLKPTDVKEIVDTPVSINPLQDKGSFQDIVIVNPLDDDSSDE
jgi:hypothetical protein